MARKPKTKSSTSTKSSEVEKVVDSTPKPAPKPKTEISRETVLKALSKVVHPTRIEKYGDFVLDACKEFGIDTKLRLAAFLAQILHESGNFQYVSENLNYSAGALRSVFGKYFPTGSMAQEYARRPEKIANLVYANRLGNGKVLSGDGWAYRGRGLIQITGKYNYKECGKALGVDLLEYPSYLETPEGAARSAAWFWDSRSLNSLADKGGIKSITKKINGGYNGLEDRVEKYEYLTNALGLND
jgi:putative chitinase